MTSALRGVGDGFAVAVIVAVPLPGPPCAGEIDSQGALSDVSHGQPEDAVTVAVMFPPAAANAFDESDVEKEQLTLDWVIEKRVPAIMREPVRVVPVKFGETAYATLPSPVPSRGVT